MLDEFRQLGLSDAARELGVDPFEVVRLIVAFGPEDAPLTMKLDQVSALRVKAGIEDWWTDATLPDESPREQLLQYSSTSRRALATGECVVHGNAPPASFFLEFDGNRRLKRVGLMISNV